MVPGGIGPLLEDLSSGLELRLTCEVDSVKLVDSDECRARVTIIAENGSKEDIDADYVVVAVPLQVLQKVSSSLYTLHRLHQTWLFHSCREPNNLLFF